MERVVTTRTGALGLGLALAGLLAASAAAAPLSADAPGRADAAVLEDVENAILRYPFYTVFDAVSVSVDAGTVELRGSVKEPYRKSDIEKRVAGVPGVRAVKNEIAVQAVSIYDDRLRAQLVRAIYGNEMFSRYAHWADPPIRILVDRGNITLAGNVASEVERVVLGHIARGMLAFKVDNQVQLEKESPRKAGGSQS